MRTTRFEPAEGYWADMLVEPRHREYYELQKVQERASNPLTGSATDAELAFGRIYVQAWNLTDDMGQPIPLDDWSEAEPRLTEAICAEAVVRFREWEASRPPLAVRTPDLPKSDGTPATPSDAMSGASG